MSPAFSGTQVSVPLRLLPSSDRTAAGELRVASESVLSHAVSFDRSAPDIASWRCGMPTRRKPSNSPDFEIQQALQSDDPPRGILVSHLSALPFFLASSPGLTAGAIQ